jgi:hypothetical protein
VASFVVHFPTLALVTLKHRHNSIPNSHILATEIVLDCTVLYYTVLFCTVLHNIQGGERKGDEEEGVEPEKSHLCMQMVPVEANGVVQGLHTLYDWGPQ